MYLEMPMVENWDTLLTLFAEIRKALAETDEERTRAHSHPLTITKEEFYELKESWSDIDDARWDELIAKFIDFDDGLFLDTSYAWCLHMGPDVTLAYDEAEQKLVLGWDLHYPSSRIIPMLQRISLVLPPNTKVSYDHVNVHRSLRVRDGVVVQDVTMEESGLTATGHLLGFVLEMAMHYYEVDKYDLNIPETPPDPPDLFRHPVES